MADCLAFLSKEAYALSISLELESDEYKHREDKGSCALRSRLKVKVLFLSSR